MQNQVQLVCFVILSVVAVLAWRKYREKYPPKSEQPLLNQRALQYQGRIFTLDHAIINGAGKVVVDDSTSKVKRPDLPAGIRVRVIGVDGVDGTVFVVEPVS